MPGYLLHEHGIRVLPTLSAPTALRIQPSAFLSDSDIDRLVARVGRHGGVAAQRGFRDVDAPSVASRLRGMAATAGGDAAEPRRERSARDEGADPGGVLGESELRRGSARPRAGIGPVVGSAARDHAGPRSRGSAPRWRCPGRPSLPPPAKRVEVIMIAVPLTSAQIVACQRTGQGAFLRDMVLEGVDLAVEFGAEVVGLGGHTSIVTGAGRDVVEDRVRVTTGNSLTAACVFDQLREELAAIAPGQRHVAIVGAIGNIGAAMAELLVPHSDTLILVGRRGSESRLRQLAERFDGVAACRGQPGSRGLARARVVIAATNAAHPIIDLSHLAGDRSVVVCDLAVPGDVARLGRRSPPRDPGRRRADAAAARPERRGAGFRPTKGGGLFLSGRDDPARLRAGDGQPVVWRTHRGRRHLRPRVGRAP